MRFSSTTYYSLLLCCLSAPMSLLAKDARPGVAQMHQPLSFIENKGQITDQNKEARNDIQYQLSAPGMSMYVGNGQLHYQFSRVEKKSTDAIATNNYRMDVTLLGANTHAVATASEKQHFFENYYLSKQYGVTANAYNRIVYKDVYPNIDWVLYTDNGKVEYDFVVRPGGNPADIKIKYDGATALNLQNDGSIAAVTPLGRISEQQPVAYEATSKKAVASKFIVHDNVVSFATGKYDGTLTIDPTVLWSTYMGGTATDEATCVATSNTGNVYMAGYTASTGIATSGAYQSGNAGGTYDAFVAKYDGTGAIQWITYFGGSAADQATGIACQDDNVFVTGYTTSPDGIATGTAYQGANGGGNDGFLASFDGTGAIVWATYFGGAGDDYAYSVACNSGSVYIGGSTNSATGIATNGSYQSALSGSTDGFIAKFDGGGNIQWSTYYGGFGTDQVNGVATDANDDVFATGQTNSTIGIATTGAYQATLGGSTDAFVAKLDGSGQRQWSTYYGGSGADQANGIASNAAGSVGIAGSTTSSNGIATATAYQATYANGFSDAFAAVFGPDGSVTWGSYIGGPGLDYGQAVTFDDANNIYIAGATYSTSGIAAGIAYQAANGGAEDAFLTKLTGYGQIFYSTYFGNTNYDLGYGVAASNGYIYLAGASGSSTGIATTGSAQDTYGGGSYDAFLTRFDHDTNVTINQPFTDTLLCQGGTFNVLYNTNFTFMPDNTFTVQLSDADGSFAVPTVIGSTTAGTSGNISCTIPGTAEGTGYRIRIVSTDPAMTSPDDIYNMHIINSLPAPTASSNNPICTGGNIYLTSTISYTAAGYSWTGPLGYSSTEQNPTITDVTDQNAGTYTITVTHASCPSQTASVDVAINSNIPPAPTVTHSTPTCIGGTLSFTATPTNPAPDVTFSFVGPNGFTANIPNPTINNLTTADSGFYYVTDTIEGCVSATDTVLISVNQFVTPHITISTPNDTTCLGQDVVLTATAMDGGTAPQYQWMVDMNTVVGGISNTYGSANFNNGDTLYCILTSSEGCVTSPTVTSNKIVLDIEPYAAPTVSITASIENTPGEDITFTATATNGGNSPVYTWMVNGVMQTGSTTNTFTSNTLIDGDVVTVQILSSSPCATPNTATSNADTVHYSDGVKNISSAFNNVVLYPDPNQGVFAIKGSLSDVTNTKATYEILNTQGQVISKENMPLQNGAFNQTITLNAALPDGIYTVRITTNGQSSVLRFTLQR